jgi:hypothetical protein
LPTSKPCACIAGSATYSSCKYQNPNDCCDLSYTSDAEGGSGDNFDKPVCNGTTQIAAKAYPGLREIAILHDYALNSTAVQGNSVVASICAKDVTGDPSSAGYGYNPAIDALVARMKEKGFR